jgi:hypothetical protein
MAEIFTFFSTHAALLEAPNRLKAGNGCGTGGALAPGSVPLASPDLACCQAQGEKGRAGDNRRGDCRIGIYGTVRQIPLAIF